MSAQHLLVDAAARSYDETTRRGAHSIRDPWCAEDDYGHIWRATIATYGDTVHTFVQRTHYTGPMAPGYQPFTLPADEASLRDFEITSSAMSSWAKWTPGLAPTAT